MGPVPPSRSQTVRALPGSQGRAAGLTPLRQLQAKSWATATLARLWKNCSPHFTAGPGAWEQPGGPSKGATQPPRSRLEPRSRKTRSSENVHMRAHHRALRSSRRAENHPDRRHLPSREQRPLYPRQEILSNQKAGAAGTCYHPGELSQHDVDRKRPDTKGHVVQESVRTKGADAVNPRRRWKAEALLPLREPGGNGE